MVKIIYKIIIGADEDSKDEMGALELENVDDAKEWILDVLELDFEEYHLTKASASFETIIERENMYYCVIDFNDCSFPRHIADDFALTIGTVSAIIGSAKVVL